MLLCARRWTKWKTCQSKVPQDQLGERAEIKKLPAVTEHRSDRYDLRSYYLSRTVAHYRHIPQLIMLRSNTYCRDMLMLLELQTHVIFRYFGVVS